MAALYDEGLLSYDARFHQPVIWVSHMAPKYMTQNTPIPTILSLLGFESDSTFTFTLVRIADYWPEFAQKGKEKTTVADLMRHEV